MTADTPPTPPEEPDLSASYAAALDAAAAAVEAFRFIPDFGDGQPAVRMGSSEESAKVALDAAIPLLIEPYRQAFALMADRLRTAERVITMLCPPPCICTPEERAAEPRAHGPEAAAAATALPSGGA